VYRFDPRDADKQDIARELLLKGSMGDELVVPHQAIVEFVSKVTRPRIDLDGAPLLTLGDALLEAEDLLAQFPVLYPTVDVLRTAMRGVATYHMSWFDAHLWAHAEVHGVPEILSEDFEHGRHYGRVRVTDPFLRAAGGVGELPALYSR
jgi:predicted nucleic acid-binding protein